VALVTGAASGIGRATTELFAGEGASIIVADVREAEATSVASEIVTAGGRACALALDVADEAAWEAAIGFVTQEFGRLDVLVNSAGISAAAPVAEMTLAEWRRIHAVNLDGVFLGTRAGIRLMAGQGGGAIVNVASVSGINPTPGASAYASSKAGVIHFTKSAALECAKAGNGVRVTVIAPGGVKTPMWQTMPFWQELAREGEAAAWAKLDPQGRFHTAEEVAIAILGLVTGEGGPGQDSLLILDRSA
jgi:NAD(P)-dependent dehydrogenase (short-subunit alcohol dehydrogenase family)